ncbi:hypothetical protein EHE21_15725 [Proteus sp. GOKU]|uniref:hypothetical protein n=1 Tax=Proteus TaxID=583 RepID=UPI001892C208|nr:MULTISPECIES: hypothetical protein [Proteus]QPB80733.1 hypothetical protein EHE21_15725 [Proteus sp. GOKU]QQP26740.1 hypothetical protein D7029_15725 [Proteus vulgaris]
MSLIIFILVSLCICIWICVQHDKFMLNSDSLHKQWLFRLAIVFPLISSLYFIVCLGYPYPWRFDAYGYSTFLEINKFSLGILALSPILGAFVVSAHRSIQTTKQIKVTEEKNRADLYYSKRKFIIEQLEDLTFYFPHKIDNANYIYGLFRKYEDFNDKKNEELYSDIDLRILELHNITNKIDNIIKEKINNKNPTAEFANFHNIILDIPYITNLILNKCGIILKNELKIEEIIKKQDKEYSRNHGETFVHKMLKIQNNRISLAREIKLELSNIHKSLHEFFSIILLDEDILKTLPNLNKINYTTKDNSNEN